MIRSHKLAQWILECNVVVMIHAWVRYSSDQKDQYSFLTDQCAPRTTSLPSRPALPSATSWIVHRFSMLSRYFPTTHEASPHAAGAFLNQKRAVSLAIAGEIGVCRGASMQDGVYEQETLVLQLRTAHLYPPVWVDPTKHPFCDVCGIKFTRAWGDGGAKVPHYCRICGNRVCSLCSGKYLLEPRFEKKKKHRDSPSRVCFGCRDGCLLYWHDERPVRMVISREGYAESLVDGETHIHPPLWREKSSYQQCFSCMRLKHRHNCRVCGELFCSDCSVKLDVPREFRLKQKLNPVRVCLECRFRIYSGAVLDPTPPAAHIERGEYSLESFARMHMNSRRVPKNRKKKINDKIVEDETQSVDLPTGTCPWAHSTDKDTDENQSKAARGQFSSTSTTTTNEFTSGSKSFQNELNHDEIVGDEIDYSDPDDAPNLNASNVGVSHVHNIVDTYAESATNAAPVSNRRIRILWLNNPARIDFVVLDDVKTLRDVKVQIQTQIETLQTQPFTIALFGRPIFEELLDYISASAVKAQLTIRPGPPPDAHI